jgi:CRISPR/Cas system CMR-associated protein Cmr1 (group 7 of RAMP superfamily)
LEEYIQQNKEETVKKKVKRLVKRIALSYEFPVACDQNIFKTTHVSCAPIPGGWSKAATPA